jgi:DNA-binding MarR family transcriptional regulator
MDTHSPFKSAYLRFLQLVAAVDQMSGLDDFDANEKALFDSLCLRWSQGKAMTVREAISQTNLGSPATLHKRLKRLIAKQLIVAAHEGQDKRAKYLVPSEKGQAYIDWLSSKMQLVEAN